jgi:hypothetical protein
MKSVVLDGVLVAGTGDVDKSVCSRVVKFGANDAGYCAGSPHDENIRFNRMFSFNAELTDPTEA